MRYPSMILAIREIVHYCKRDLRFVCMCSSFYPVMCRIDQRKKMSWMFVRLSFSSWMLSDLRITG